MVTQRTEPLMRQDISEFENRVGTIRAYLLDRKRGGAIIIRAGVNEVSFLRDHLLTECHQISS